jgi:signal transduction histidine kinase/CheY-like chemotaxis protein/ABC-type amino acid transport substrate-binding protein
MICRKPYIRRPFPGLSFWVQQRGISSVKETWCRILICLLIFPIFAFSQQEKAPLALRVGLPQLEPMVYRDKQSEPSGFQIEILLEIAEKENWNLEFVDGTWNDCYFAIQNGEIDLLPFLTRTKERESIFDFVDPPFYQKWTAVYIRQNEKLSSVTQLKGKRIGLMEGDQNASAFIIFLDDYDISWTPVWYKSYKEVFQALNDHEVDAVASYIDESSTYGEFRHAKSTGLAFAPRPLTIGFSKGKLPHIRETINNHLIEFKKDQNSNYNRTLKLPMYIKPSETSLPVWGKWLFMSLATLLALLFVIVVFLRGALFRGKLALKASEKTYQTMVENLTVCLSILKLQFDHTGKIQDAIFLSANPEYCQFYNISGKKTRHSFYKKIHGVDAFNEWNSLFTKAYQQKKSLEFSITEPQTNAWIEGRLVLFQNNLLTLLFTDRTEQKNNSEALVENECKFRHFFDKMKDGVVILNQQKEHGTFRVVDVNKALVESLELNWPSNQDIYLSELFPTQSKDLKGKIKEQFFDLNSPVNRSFNWECGARIFQIEAFQLNDNLIGIIFVEQTEERAKNLLQAHSDSTSYAHLQSIHECLIYINRENKVLWANNQTLRYTGLTLPEIQQNKCFNFLCHNNSPPEDCPLQEALATKRIVVRDEYKHPNGDVFSIAMIPHLDNNGEVLYVLEAFANITELRKKEERNTQIQKMEILGRLSGGIAHDFNNILQAVLGFGDILKFKLQKSPEHLSAIQAIIDAGKHGAKLVQQLMSFSRREQYEPIPIDLNEQIENSTMMLKRIIGEGTTLEFNPYPKQLPILADPNQIDQAIINLCINARDAIDHSNGKIILTSSLQQGEATHNTPVTQSISLEISDNGCGIPEEIIEEIFEPFFTTKEKDKGTGLGLASVNDIIIRHGGRINIDSQVGVGTTIHLNFPVYNYHQAPSSVRRDQTEFLSTHQNINRCILLAEDNDKAAEFTTTMLKNFGCKVYHAQNGLEAIKAFEDHRDEIDLFLFDVVMPGMNGPQAHQKIIKMGANQPIIYCSGKNLEQDPINASKEKNTYFLPKPFRSKQLLEKLNEALKQKNSTRKCLNSE